jgi:hypothetical protein
MLGFKVQRIEFHSRGRLRYAPGRTLDFAAGGTGAAHVDECWSLPDERGCWMLGNRAGLRVILDDRASGDLPAAFVISAGTPGLRVIVKANGLAAAEWVLDGAYPQRQFATIPAATVAAAPELALAFEIGGAQPLPQSRGFQLARAVIGSGEIDLPTGNALGRGRPMYQRVLGLPGYAMHVARILVERYFQ